MNNEQINWIKCLAIFLLEAGILLIFGGILHDYLHGDIYTYAVTLIFMGFFIWFDRWVRKQYDAE